MDDAKKYLDEVDEAIAAIYRRNIAGGITAVYAAACLAPLPVVRRNLVKRVAK